jgi:aspartate-semialdehyde dehydrogenase
MTVTTLQGLSGAGYPGVASLDTLDSILPEISGEEDKLRCEPSKIFGTRRGDAIEPAEVTVSAQCNRVPVRDGHLLSISARLEKQASIEEARRAYTEYEPSTAGLNLPSAPRRPVHLLDVPNRPQTLLDRDREGGMAVTVGRLESCPVNDVRCVAVVHNAVRGAAGGTILVAELLVANGVMPA